MSKELAQTVGGKRIAWLLAILAAVAVFATVASSTRKDAKADIASEALFTVSRTPNTAGTIAPGGTVTYTLSWSGLINSTTGNFQVVATLPAGMADFTITAVNPVSGVQPTTCTGIGTGVVTCTYPPLTSADFGTLDLVLTRSATGGTIGQAIIPPVFTVDDAGAPAPLTVTTNANCSLPSPNPCVAPGAIIRVQPVLSTLTKTQTAGATSITGQPITYTITTANSAAANVIAATGVHILDTVPAGVTVFAVTATGGSVNTCTPAIPGTGTAGPVAIDCNIGTLATGATATVTITGVITAAPAAGASTVISNTATLTSTNTAGQTSNTVTTTVNGAALPAAPVLCTGLFHLDPNGNILVGPFDAVANCYPALQRDVPNNTLTTNHYVCLVQRGQTAVNLLPLGIDPPTTSGYRFRINTVTGQPNVNGQVITTRTLNGTPLAAGGDPATLTNAPVFAGAYVFPLSAVLADWTAVRTGTQITVQAETLQCVRWYSTTPGEQNVTVVDPAGNVIADWANGTPDGSDFTPAAPFITAFTPLVKEWNTLTYTEIYDITAGLSAPVLVTNGQLTGTITQNPGTGLLSGTSATLAEYVWGTHQNATGTFNGLVIGARVTFTRTGTCGAFSLVDTNSATTGPLVTGVGPFPTFNTASGPYTNVTGSVTVTSVGVPIPFTLNAGQGLTQPNSNSCSSVTGSTTGISIVVSYPNNTGSVTPVLPPETIMLTWQFTQPAKQVILAWAGQRVMLEHDWRFQPGESVGMITPRAGAVCSQNVFGRKIVYIKGIGPGNFVPGLGALLNGSDSAYVGLTGDINQALDNGQTSTVFDAPTRPQDACISRVIFESEDQGEVDIEVFGADLPSNGLPGSLVVQTDKWAYVIYYMKLERVDLSLVTQVSKPTHNSTESDYAPGNPWDSTKDAKDATADWNVSKDLLVRGLVKGWFTSSNPSGRVAGTDSNGGGLPAGRWVMPDDWPLLFGGPADPADGTDARGIAESFRPQYDYMIAPNAGRSFSSPEGLGAETATIATTTALSDTGTTVGVNSTTTLFPGTCIRIDNEWMRVDTRSVASGAGTITVSRLFFPVDVTLLTFLTNCALGQVPTAPVAHAAGAKISQNSGVPFEGPISLVDLASLSVLSAHTSTGGAALSNFVIGEIRDTIWGDTDIDKWDAPMPPAAITVDIRGAGFIKQIDKSNVYYIGTPNRNSVLAGGDQVYPNPYYITNIPESPYLPASVAGGSYYWDSWGNDGPGGASGQGVYRFWTAIPSYIAFAPGRNPAGITDTSVTAAQIRELNNIRGLYGCLFPTFGVTEPCTIGRTLVVYSDNHGEFMVTANGDFKLTYDACASNALGGGKHCKPGDKVGASTITAVADYPDFKGKHYPLSSNQAKVNWTWGGYKSVSVEKGETDQYKYIVFHALDRDGFCTNSAALLGLDESPVLLHPVLTSIDGGSAVTTLTQILTATSTVMTVANPAGFAVGQLVRIENELVIITAINGNLIEFVGPVYGTSASVHPIGAIVIAGLASPVGQLTASVINGGDLLLNVSTTAGLSVGDTIRIDDELMTITGLTPTSITVTRGANGSTPGAHIAGAVILQVNSVDFTTTPGLQKVGALGPIELVDFLIDSGEGIILNTSGGGFIDAGKQFASSVPTYSTLAAPSTFKKFPLSSLAATGAKDECQAYIRVSNSLLSVVNVLTVAHDDEGDIGFDSIIDLTNTTTYTLAFRWSLVTFDGADGISPTDALKATGKNTGGTNIYDKVTAVYGWNQASQTWLGFFPSGVGVPGANDLTALRTGQAYWIAITGPDSVTWTVVTNVN